MPKSRQETSPPREDRGRLMQPVGELRELPESLWRWRVERTREGNPFKRRNGVGKATNGELCIGATTTKLVDESTAEVGAILAIGGAKAGKMAEIRIQIANLKLVLAAQIRRPTAARDQASDESSIGLSPLLRMPPACKPTAAALPRQALPTLPQLLLPRPLPFMAQEEGRRRAERGEESRNLTTTSRPRR